MFDMWFELPTIRSQGELSTNCTIEHLTHLDFIFFQKNPFFYFCLIYLKNLKLIFLCEKYKKKIGARAVKPRTF